MNKFIHDIEVVSCGLSHLAESMSPIEQDVLFLFLECLHKTTKEMSAYDSKSSYIVE